MASSFPAHFVSQIVLLVSLVSFTSAARTLPESKTQNTMLFQYHNGQLLTGPFSVNLIWYGKFKPSHRAIITDFIASLCPSDPTTATQPSVSQWWKGTDKYYHLMKSKKLYSVVLSLGTQVLDETYSLGKTLSNNLLAQLASKVVQNNAINVVLTSSDVTVDGFCSDRCGTHGSIPMKNTTYIWVGNSEVQCPGFCAWPFHQPAYGPQGPPLVAPNGEVGLDGMVINLAGLLAGTVTNPFGNGCFQGPKEAPLEAASACPGVYAKGAYPGYPGNLLVDSTTGASYNANGVNGRKYLVPALFDPSSSTCSTPV